MSARGHTCGYTCIESLLILIAYSVKNAESIIFRGAKLLPEGLHGHTCRGFRRLEITEWAIHCGRYGFGLLIVGRSGSSLMGVPFLAKRYRPI